MFDVRSLSLLTLFLLFSDSFGAVIQPRLYDDSSNHRRSMLKATNHIPIEARSDRAPETQRGKFKRRKMTPPSTSDPTEVSPSSKRRKLGPPDNETIISLTGASPEASTSSTVLPDSPQVEGARPDAGLSISTHQRGRNPVNLFNQGAVYLEDLNSHYPSQPKTSPGLSLLVVRHPPTPGDAVHVLLNVKELGNNRNILLKPIVFKACGGVTFTEKKKLESFVPRYLPWSFFEGKKSVGTIGWSNIALLQAVPDTSFKSGDVVQMPASSVHRPKEDNLPSETFLTALCVIDVPEAGKAARFAVLTGNPGETPYYSVSGLEIPTHDVGQVLAVFTADKPDIITIGRLSSGEIKLMRGMIKHTTSSNAASIRPTRWVTFGKEHLLRWKGDTRVVETDGRDFFGIVLEPPKKAGDDGSIMAITVAVFIYDRTNEWGEGYFPKNAYNINKETLLPPWKILPGYVRIDGVTRIGTIEDYRQDSLARLVKNVHEDADGQPRPHIWSNPCPN